MKISMCLVLFFVFFSHSAAEESKPAPAEDQQGFKHKSWVVAYSKEHKIALAYNYEKNNPKGNPNLDISCQYREGIENELYLSLFTEAGFNTKESDSVMVMLQIDKGPSMEHMWFPSEKKLDSVGAGNLINSMMDAEDFSIRFRDKAGLNEYHYVVDGLKKVIPVMKKVCNIK